MGISFVGIGSGFDSQSMIDKLYAIERLPAQQAQQRKGDVTRRISIVGDLVSRIQALQSQLDGLNVPSLVRSMAATSTDATRIVATASSTAVAGTYNISVGALATAQTSRSQQFATDTAGVAGTGSVQITVGGNPAVSVSYGPTDLLEDIAARINASGARVTASVLFDGTRYQIMMTGKDTGAANAISFTESGNALGFAQVGSTVVAAANAQMTVNGVAVTRPSNSATDVIPGVTLQLASTTPGGAPATVVSVATDSAAMQKKVQGVVDSFNAVASVVSQQLTYGGTKKGQDTFFGDSTFRGLQLRLATALTSVYSDGTASTGAGDLGIAIGRDGTLKLDTAKLSTALTSDPQSVQRFLLGSGTNGFAAAIHKIGVDYTQSTTGIMTAKSLVLGQQASAYDKQIQRYEDAALSMKSRLQKQFTQLDLTMTKLNQQQSYLTQLFGTGSSTPQPQ